MFARSTHSGNAKASNCGTSKSTDLTFFIRNYIMPERGSDGGRKFSMIAMGRTCCKYERDVVMQGFVEQLQILAQEQKKQEVDCKAALYDIMVDATIDEEEKRTRKKEWEDLLEDLGERHIRIRRSIFIGLYSFWEISLQELLNMIKDDDSNANECPNRIVGQKARRSKSNKNDGVDSYLSRIYGDENLPEKTAMINGAVREFRNYMVHNSLYPERQKVIDGLVNDYPKYCVKPMSGGYYISDYKGLSILLGEFEQELNRAEASLQNKLPKSK